jgi:hypothetical protein
MERTAIQSGSDIKENKSEDPNSIFNTKQME